jgi:thioredoxin-related protein
MKIDIKRRILPFLLFTAAALVLSGCQDRGSTLSKLGADQKSESSLVFDEAAYPPNGWTFSMAEAAERASEEDKMILINFTGSDWCVWCQKLEKEVFSTQEYLDWASENLVMVFLDFPQAIEQPENILQQNQMMQQAMGVQGFPTLMLLDSDLTPLLQTGYKEGGASSYIAHLKNDHIDISEEDAENFRTGFGQMIRESLVPLGIE